MRTSIARTKLPFAERSGTVSRGALTMSIPLACSWSSIGVALSVAAATPWLVKIPIYRARRFGDEAWVAMAVCAFVFVYQWHRSERARSRGSALRFVARAALFAMATSATAAALWVVDAPRALSAPAIAAHLLYAALVSVVAALVPIWVAPLLCVLVVYGVAMRRAQGARTGPEVVSDGAVPSIAFAASCVLVALAFADRLPEGARAVAYVSPFVQWLAIAAMLVNGLVVARQWRATPSVRWRSA